MGNVVNLLVCRPHDENFRKLSATNLEVPVPPLRSSFNMKHQQYMNQLELSPGVRILFLPYFIPIIISPAITLNCNFNLEKCVLMTMTIFLFQICDPFLFSCLLMSFICDVFLLTPLSVCERMSLS